MFLTVCQKNVLQEPIIKPTPLKFETYMIGKQSNIISYDFTHTWAHATNFTTGIRNIPSEPPLLNERAHGIEEGQKKYIFGLQWTQIKVVLF